MNLLRLTVCVLAVVSAVHGPVALGQTLGTNPYGALTSGLPPVLTPAQSKLRYKLIAHEEARKAGLPSDLVDAVIAIESSYDPSRIGSVGEIGLMQVRPGTAAMLGFKGHLDELALPETNIHYGAAYLGQAWRLANGDICRTLMKYRAGHGEEVMSPLSDLYCAHARAHLTAAGSPLAKVMVAMVLPEVPPEDNHPLARTGPGKMSRRPMHGPGFWAWHDARVQAITARIEARWRRVAAR